VKDDKCSGRPTSRTDENIAAVEKIVKEDRNITSWLIADALAIPKTVVLRILREDLKNDNCAQDSAAIIQQFLTQKQVATLKHPPYSPYLSPPTTSCSGR
jgi:ribosomal protein S25